MIGCTERKVVENPARILEFASGSGMHINFFAPHFGHLHFHPTDKDIEVFDNIKKLTVDHKNDNIADHDLELKEQIDMPANNFTLVFGRKK